jgi:hypothetical protein
MQREKLFNKLWFLVPPHYNGYDMSQCTVTLRYLLPISKEFKTETLVLSDERYEEYLKYVLPVDTNLTKEWGEIELNLTFTMVDVDNNGNFVQRVRKTDNHILNITQLPDWDKFVPDSALSAIDQRILKQDAQIKALNDLAGSIGGNINIVNNLVYDENDDTLQLSANGVGVGNKVSVKDMLDDGMPVVDFNPDSGIVEINPNPDSDEELENDNVIEF